MDIDDRFVTKRKQSRLHEVPSTPSPSSTISSIIPSTPQPRLNLDQSYFDPPLTFETLSISRRPAPALRRSMSSKAKIIFPAARIKRYLREDRFATKISPKSCVYLAAVLEYLTAEILDISSDVASQSKRKRINPRYLTLGIKSDEELNRLLPNVTIKQGGILPENFMLRQQNDENTTDNEL